MIELLLMEADELKDPVLFERAMDLVGEARRSHVEKLRKNDSKNLSLAAGLLLRYAFFMVRNPKLYDQIQVSPGGKPFLPNQEYYFSLSHSGQYAICCFSDSPVGCDIEKIREYLPRFTKKIFTADEEATYHSLLDVEKGMFFYQLWTCKESVTKWMGKGILHPFHFFSVMDGKKVKMSIPMEEINLYLKSYFFENYALSLCSERDEFPREIKRLTSEILMKN